MGGTEYLSTVCAKINNMNNACTIVEISDAYPKNPNDSNNSTSSIIVRSLYYPPPIHRLHMRIGSGIRLSRLGRGVTAVTRVTHCHNTGHRSHTATGHTITIHWCCQRLCRIKMDSQLWKRQSLSRHKERALVGAFSIWLRTFGWSFIKLYSPHTSPGRVTQQRKLGVRRILD